MAGFARAGCSPFGTMHMGSGSREDYLAAEARNARENIRQVNADRASDRNVEATQLAICRKISSLHDVLSCECVIGSEIIQIQHEDGHVTAGSSTTALD